MWEVQSEHEDRMEIIRFSAMFFVRPTGSCLIGEMKTSINDEKKWRTRHPQIFQKW